METCLKWGGFRFRSRTPKPFNIFQPNFTDVLIRSCSGAFCYLQNFTFVIFLGFHGNVSEMGQIFRFRSRTLKPFNNFQPNFTDVLIRSCNGAFWHLENFRIVIFPGFHGNVSEMGQIFRFRSRTPKPFNIFQPNFTDVLIRSWSGVFWHFLEFYGCIIFLRFPWKQVWNGVDFSFPEQNSETVQ